MDVRSTLARITTGVTETPVAATSVSVPSIQQQVAVATQAVSSESAALETAVTTVDTVASSKMGIYLESGQDDGLPRWTVLTALRAYGLNIAKKPEVEQVVQAARVFAQMKESPATPAHVATLASKPAVKAADPAKVEVPGAHKVIVKA